jgi:hypothetical protein
MALGPGCLLILGPLDRLADSALSSGLLAHEEADKTDWEEQNAADPSKDGEVVGDEVWGGGVASWAVSSCGSVGWLHFFYKKNK